MRSAHDAVRAAQELVKQGKRYVMDIDRKSFFDEVKHDKLMHLFDKHIEYKSLKELIGAILRAPVQRPESGLSNKRLYQYGFILPWTFAEAAPEKW